MHWRRFIFFRGICLLRFEPLPWLFIRLVFSTCNVFPCPVNAVVHGIKVMRFRNETKVRVYKPALCAVQVCTRHVYWFTLALPTVWCCIRLCKHLTDNWLGSSHKALKYGLSTQQCCLSHTLNLGCLVESSAALDISNS